MCAVNIIGSSVPNEGPYEEPDMEHSPANDQKDSNKEESEYVALELVARTPSCPSFGFEIWPFAGPRARQGRTADGT